MIEFLAGILIFLTGFFVGATIIYIAFDKELKDGRVISGSRVYRATRICQ